MGISIAHSVHVDFEFLGFKCTLLCCTVDILGYDTARQVQPKVCFPRNSLR